MEIQTINSKQIGVNVFPDNWEIFDLETLGTFSKGKGISKSELVETGMPCIRYGELYTTHNYVVNNYISYISEITASQSKKITKGDILFTGSGETIEEIGKSVAIIKNDLAYAGGDIIILSTNDLSNSVCLSYALETDYVRKQKRRLGQGNSVVHIYAKNLSKITVALPPITEQKAIAKALSLMDKTINANNQLIIQKELQKKWLMQNLMSGKKRLSGFSDEWKENKLEHYIDEYKKKPTENDKYEVLTSAKSGLMKQTDYYGNNRITNRTGADYNVIPPNFLTYRSRSDDGLFTFNKNTLELTGLISGYYPVFTIINGDCDFILMYMNFYRKKLTKYSIGTSQLVLSMKALKNAKFILPDSEEQTAIAQLLQAADKEIKLLKVKTDKLKEQKKGMMQVLLTGKKRLKL